MHEATEAYDRLAGVESEKRRLTTTEANEFRRARRKVLEAIGCRFTFGESRAEYTNMLSFIKDELVVQLTQDAWPANGLPNAERISGINLLRSVDGHARGRVVSYQRGKWDRRIADAQVQRTIDEIAAAVG